MTGETLLLAAVFLPPGAAFGSYALGRRSPLARDVFVLTVVSFIFSVSFLLVLYYPNTELRLIDFEALALHFRLDALRALYGCVTAFLWLVTSIFSPEYFARSSNKNRYWMFNLLTLGAVMGVFFSADFRTAFVFFEIMSFCSYALVAHDQKETTLRAAETYLAVAIIGGLSQLLGMLFLRLRTGTLEFAGLYEVCAGMADKSSLYLPGILLLVGFGAKAGMYPLHIWLPKAHPVAPAPASALLSGILTKTGVLGIIVLSFSVFVHDYRWGIILLVPAVITMVLGALLGILSNDLKRTLACSSVSQIGFILTGLAVHILAGLHNGLAMHGVLLHMVNHSLFKLLLFTAAGVVYMNRHELGLDKIRGFGRGKPLFLFVFLMAALGISAMPFLSGYVSKTLLHKGIVEAIYLYQDYSFGGLLVAADFAFLFAGGLTIAYMTKLFVALFVERSDVTEKKYLSRPAAIALGLVAVTLPLLGCFPIIGEVLAGWTFIYFPVYAADYAVHYFTWANMKYALLSVAIGIPFFILTRSPLKRIIPSWFDLENFLYRPFLKYFVKAVFFLAIAIAHAIASLPDAMVAQALKALMFVREKPAARNFLLRAYLHHRWSLRTISRRTPIAARSFLLRKYLFYSRHLLRSYLLYSWRLKSLWRKGNMIGGFSMALLLAGSGICITILYVFIHSLGQG